MTGDATGSTLDEIREAGFAARWHPPLLAAMPRIALTLLGAHAQRHYLGP